MSLLWEPFVCHFYFLTEELNGSKAIARNAPSCSDFLPFFLIDNPARNFFMTNTVAKKTVL